MKFKTVEEVAAAITVRNYLNMVLDNAGIKIPSDREESRRIKNLPGQIDEMIIASVGDVFFEKKVETKMSQVELDEEHEMKMDSQTSLPAKKGSFKRAK